jgi:transposase
MVRSDPQHRVDVPQRIGVVGFAAKAVAAGDRDEVVLAPVAVLALHPEPNTGISWPHLPLELGFGAGVTCWRRLDEWQKAGVWEQLHELLLARLRAAGEIEWSRAVVDATHVQAKKGLRDGAEPG